SRRRRCSEDATAGAARPGGDGDGTALSSGRHIISDCTCTSSFLGPCTLSFLG
ncbi:Os07g0159200, partial [Oryza sativa Japonica Group]